MWWHSVGGQTLILLTEHLWSLAVEEQFYLVWPVVILLVRDRRRLMWVALALALTAPVTRAVLLAQGAGYAATYKITACRADSLLGGAWLALAVRGALRERLLRWAPWVFLAGLAGCFAIVIQTGNFDWEVNRTVNLVGFSVVAVTSGAWLAMSLQTGRVAARLMNAGWLRFFGKYSYGIYVLHMPLGAAVQRWLMPWVNVHVRNKAALHLTEMALVMCVTVPMAMLSFKFFERPFLQLKRYFEYQRSRGQSYPA